MHGLCEVKKNLEKNDQSQLLHFYDQLSTEEQGSLLKDLTHVDIPHINGLYQKTNEKTSNGHIENKMEPIPNSSFGSTSRSNNEDLEKWKKTGLKCISEGKVAVLVLAGGQGTRLGVGYPKGMYNVGIPSEKTLYQVNAEKIKRLQEWAFEEFGKQGIVTWYIMTSETTKSQTEKFFDKHDFFGLNEKNVVIFEQFTLPCINFDGKILLSEKHKVACSPDGNGGLYKALRKCKILDDMRSRGVECVHVHCVDNILQKTADPVFVGFCRSRNADCGAKVVEKTEPNEAVGVVCKLNGVYQVVEYSEISQENSEVRDDQGRLVYNAGNICNHYFTVDFLEKVSKETIDLPHHVAKKKIPFINSSGELVKPTTPNGIKFEKFVFDVFEYSKSFVVFEVLREDEFSPLKNPEGSQSCSPLQARWSLASLHHRQIIAAGGTIVQANGDEVKPLKDVEKYEGEYPVKVEISPSLSYDGENLEDHVQNCKLRSPVLLCKKSNSNGDA